jgi:anhydro-N-acetylmuramic acid kinase
MAVVSAIGLMSGTSLDGIDVALIETDGERIHRLGPTLYCPYAPDERAVLRQALAEAANLSDRASRLGILAKAEALITAAHSEAVRRFLEQTDITRDALAVVGFHGQTVLHRPQARLTVQIGDGQALSDQLGIPVVYDFRAADVAAGGQGAPLVPVFHRALVEALDRPHPIAVLNIGGVSNLTYMDGGDLIACDTGPGNALIDDFVLSRTGDPYDRDGALAARGRVDDAFLARVLAQSFFHKAPPKSLDRNDFAQVDVSAFSNEDGAATLTALTAAAIAAVVPHLPRSPASWIVAGGGAANPTLLHMLKERLKPAAVETADSIGWSAAALEAQAFAFLAVRSMKGLPLTFRGTTGVAREMTGGVLVKPV